MLNDGPLGEVAVYDVERGALEAVSPLWLRDGVSTFPSGVPGRSMLLNANQDIAAIGLDDIDDPTLFLYPGPIYQVGEVALVNVPLDSPWVAVASQGEGVIEIDLISMLDDSIFETKSVVGEGVMITSGVTVAPGSKHMIIGTLDDYFLGVPGDANSFHFQFKPYAGAGLPRFSPDGKLLAFGQGSFDTPSLRVIDAATTEPVFDRPLESGADWAFLDESRIVIAESNRITILDLATAAERTYSIEADTPQITRISPDGTSLLFNQQYLVEWDGEQNTMVNVSPEWRVIDLTTGEVTAPPEIQGRQLLGRDRSNWWLFGNVLEAGTPSAMNIGKSASMISYDVATGETTVIFEGGAGESVELLAGSTDSRYLVGNVGGPGAYRVDLVDLATGTTTILSQTTEPKRALVSPDGCMVAVGPVPDASSPGSSGSIEIFQINGTSVAHIADVEFVGWVPGL